MASSLISQRGTAQRGARTQKTEQKVEAEDKVPAEDVAAYAKWLEEYSEGRIPLFKDGKKNGQAIERLVSLFDKIAKGEDLVAARRLWQAATVQLPAELSKYERLDAQATLVQGEAKDRIAKIKGKDVDEWLLDTALRKGGRSGDLPRMTALEILGRRGNKEMGVLVLKSLSRFPKKERVQAMMTLENLANPDLLPKLIAQLRVREPGFRIAAVQAVAGTLAPFSDETKEGNLAKDSFGSKWKPQVLSAFLDIYKKERVWQVRAAVVDAMLKLKTVQSVPALIQAMEFEKKKTKKRGELLDLMLMASLHDALKALTGQDLPENSPELWKQYWERDGRKLKYAVRKAGESRPPKKKPGGFEYASYFNLDVRSKRILFVVDFSGSMAERVALTGRYAKKTDKQAKYRLVKRELEKVIRLLPKDTLCNVLFFGTDVAVWRRSKSGRPALVRMTDDNKSSLLEYVYESTPGGSTNLYGALELALEMGERGLRDKYYKAAFDTLYLLSDGAPTAGKIVDPKRILEAVQKANKLRRLKIHTIVFGDESNNLTFMRALAEKNGGKFLHVQ